ncbi:hypothetical protein HK097_001490 [Rhizophlyctis rosea]|uniref:Uncharacterized protein n=1 Tax=Rhizophlyctis rosea TaxID=64517 RepID=A0AAD5SJR2_9FUNG|nr:hypothetical protein HK097_001490 [Rhizophlyctis rosea]
MESASEERQVGWKQYRRYVDGALITAAGLGHADIVQLLLQGGALVNEGHGAVDPIVLFRAYSRAKREAMLVDMGENASWFNVYRQSDFAQAFRRDKALRRAVLKGHTQIVRLLLEAQAEIRDENDFLLRDAARFGHVDIVKLLLEAGADVHASRDDALTRAAIGGHVEVVLALLEAGADMRARKSMAYQGALDRRQTDVVRVFHSLVPARRPIDVVMERGWNAVDWVTVLNVVMTALLMYNFQPFRMAYLALVILYGNYPTGVEFTDL